MILLSLIVMLDAKMKKKQQNRGNEGEGKCVGGGMRECFVLKGKRINSTEYSQADLSLGTNLNSAIGSISSSLSSSSSSATDSFDSSRKGIKK